MNIREMIFELTGCSFTGEVQEIEKEGLYVQYQAGKAVIGSDTIPAKCRAYTLLARGITEGKEYFEISETPHFSLVGPMIDMSRGGVMKVEGIKRYLKYVAAMGLNTLMLYTEDTYEVIGYPQMGYQRGRYTLEELQEVDNFAAELGIEVIPCIQVLGHMEQLIRRMSSLKDTDKVLLVGQESTYEFLEACISTMRKAFRSKRIHIGCDESVGLGTGNYLKLNGFSNRFEIFSRHIARVGEICRKYDFRPMIWSDMYYSFALKPGQSGDYNPDVEIPEWVIQDMPDVDMVFWDYYHTDNDFYRKNIKKHRSFGRKTLFAGGIWTWDGFVPNYIHTYDTGKPALEECLRGDVKEILATLWSNDGCETSHMLGIPMLAMYSEYCWKGMGCTEEDIWGLSAFLTGVTKELAYAVSDFFFRYEGAVRAGKLILWSDPLIHTLGYKWDYETGISYLEQGIKTIKKYQSVRKLSLEIEFFLAVFQVALDKCRLQSEFRTKYKQNDREWLRFFTEEEIPLMLQNFEALYGLHYKMWHRDYKTQGFERLMHDYAGALERLRYTAKVVQEYLTGERSMIEELESDLLSGSLPMWKTQKDVMYTYQL